MRTEGILSTGWEATYKGDGPGILRKIPEESLDELRKIFEVTGGNRRYEKIEYYSKEES